MIKFIEEGHKYISTKDNVKWTSVTRLIEQFTNPFDPEQHIKSSKNKKSKWYGIDPAEIKNIWQQTNKYSTDLGTWYHKRMESAMLSCETISYGETVMQICQPIIDSDNIKYAPDQKLKNNTIYPEHFVYLKSVGLCGQVDRVEVIDNKVFIKDFKTNKELKFESYKGWDGHKMMLQPVNHLMDCNFTHYSLQLSLYMYMILKHNPQLSFGGLEILHVLFEEESRDKYDNPIYKIDEHGDFIVKGEFPYEVKYLKQECQLLMNILRMKK